MIRRGIKNIIANKFIRWLFGLIGSCFVIAIINAIVSKINLGESLINLPVKVFNLFIQFITLKTPIYIFLILIIIFILISKLRDRRLNKEHYFVLSKIANEDDRTFELRYIKSLYEQEFPDREQSDLQIILNELERRELIYETECGDYDEICFEITTEGLIHLKKLKKKFESPI